MVVSCIRCDPKASPTKFTSDIAVQAREDEVTVAELVGLAIAKNEIAQLLRHGGRLLPLDGILVFLAGRAIRCTNGVQFKEGVVCEEEDESLTDRAGGAQDTYYTDK